MLMMVLVSPLGETLVDSTAVLVLDLISSNPILTPLLCCVSQGIIIRGLCFPGSSVP